MMSRTVTVANLFFIVAALTTGITAVPLPDLSSGKRCALVTEKSFGKQIAILNKRKDLTNSVVVAAVVVVVVD